MPPTILTREDLAHIPLENQIAYLIAQNEERWKEIHALRSLLGRLDGEVKAMKEMQLRGKQKPQTKLGQP